MISKAPILRSISIGLTIPQPDKNPLNTDTMLLFILKTSIATLILAIGMTAVTDDIVYLLASAVVSIPYVLWIRKRRKRE